MAELNKGDYMNIQRLPEYAEAIVIPPGAPGGDRYSYTIDGELYRRVTTVLGEGVPKPALINWAKRINNDVIFGEYTDKKKSAVKPGGWLKTYIDQADYLQELAVNEDALLGLRKEVEGLVAATSSIPADLGTEGHALLHQILEEGAMVPLVEINPDLQPAIEGASQWLRDYGITPVATEYTVWHPHLAIAGTIDGIGYNEKGQLILWDWKRSKGIYPEMYLQLAAYCQLLRMVTGLKPDLAYIVQLPQEEVFDGPPYHVGVMPDIDVVWSTFLHAYHLGKGMRELKDATTGGVEALTTGE